MFLLLRLILLASMAAQAGSPGPSVAPVPAPPGPAVAPLLPFPAPARGPISVDAKFASGPIVTIKPDGTGLTMNTLSGLLTVIIEPSTRVLGVDSQPLPVKTGLRPGMYIRVYFVVRDGARVEEVDQLPGAVR